MNFRNGMKNDTKENTIFCMFIPLDGINEDRNQLTKGISKSATFAQFTSLFFQRNDARFALVGYEWTLDIAS